MGKGSKSKPKVAAFFDLDGTITGENTDMIATRELLRAGRYPLWPMVRGTLAYALYMMGRRSVPEIKREFIDGAFRGRREDDVLAFGRKIHRTRCQPVVYREALDALEELRADGVDTYLVSASSYVSVLPFFESFGFDGYFATKIEVDDAGFFTGRVVPPVHSAEQKGETVREVAEQKGYDLTLCHAFGDSMDDRFMLECVGHPTVVNPRRKLRELASRRGWRVAEWSRTLAAAT